MSVILERGSIFAPSRLRTCTSASLRRMGCHVDIIEQRKRLSMERETWEIMVQMADLNIYHLPPAHSLIGGIERFGWEIWLHFRQDVLF